MSPKLSIILLNLNQEVHTRECIESLQRCSYKNIEIILIDNGSIDGSGERLHKRFPSVVYHRSESNLGFPGGNNIGIRHALEHGSEYIMLLNNDTTVDPGFVEPLIDYAQANPGIGFQSCKIYLSSQPRHFWYAGGRLDVDRALSTHRGMGEEDRGQYDRIERTDFATGCMMVARRSVIEKVGPIDEHLFAYFEDADWCLRAHREGFPSIYNPGSRIWHKVSVTNKIDSPFYLYFTMRNKIIFLRRYSRPARWLVHLPYLLYFYGRHLVRMSIKWRSWSGVKAVFAGIADGLRNRTGENGKGRLDALVKN